LTAHYYDLVRKVPAADPITMTAASGLLLALGERIARTERFMAERVHPTSGVTARRASLVDPAPVELSYTRDARSPLVTLSASLEDEARDTLQDSQSAASFEVSTSTRLRSRSVSA
jgi:hypothetical protein